MSANNMLPFGAKKPTNMPQDSNGFMPYVCEVCGCPFFEQSHTILKRSRIVSPTGQDEFQPTIVFRCENCGWILGAPAEEAKKNLKRKIEEMMLAQKNEANREGCEVSAEETIIQE